MNDEKARYRYSTISPHIVDIGAQSPSNEHIDRLAGILLTYNFYEKELGTFCYSLYLEILVMSMLQQDMYKACQISVHLFMS